MIRIPQAVGDDGKITGEFALFILIAATVIVALYVIIAFFVLGVLEARDDDPPMPESRCLYGEAEKAYDRLKARKMRREAHASAWLPLLLWHVLIRWIAGFGRLMVLGVWAVLQAIRRAGVSLAKKRTPDPEPHLGPEVTKTELPKARVHRG